MKNRMANTRALLVWRFALLCLMGAALPSVRAADGELTVAQRELFESKVRPVLAQNCLKGGMTYGATDEFGFQAVEKRTQVHDLHATLLHLLGLDHEKLTYRHAGRDFRLTDVHGHVVTEILA